MVAYLVQRPNPHRTHYYPTRRLPILAVVLHITAGLEDKDMIGPDESAERTYAYASTVRDRSVSWHRGADSDGWLIGLPDEYTAFHVAGYNSCTLGLEISKRDTSWRDEPNDWITATLDNAADACRAWVANHHIPLKRATRADLDAAIARHNRTGDASPVGFVYHADLDPGRRSDPGADFPITLFLNRLRPGGHIDMPLNADDYNGIRETLRQVVRAELGPALLGDTSAMHTVLKFARDGAPGLARIERGVLTAIAELGDVDKALAAIDKLVQDRTEQLASAIAARAGIGGCDPGVVADAVRLELAEALRS